MSIQNNISSIMGDQWDDSLLIKNYDHTSKIVKEKVARIIAEKNNTNNNLPENPEATTSTQVEDIKFRIGDLVRATYIDGIDYEAKILSINEKNGICVIQYLGYDNTEEVHVSNLKNSLKKKTKRMPKVHNLKNKNKQYIWEDFAFSANLAGNPFFVIPPPMPPFPPSLEQKNDESEEFRRVLMSWYMCGYYTGFYNAKQKEK